MTSVRKAMEGLPTGCRVLRNLEFLSHYEKSEQIPQGSGDVPEGTMHPTGASMPSSPK